ncbi:DUF899 family protein, partial [Rhizobiaceae sp. 2RAB30]
MADRLGLAAAPSVVLMAWISAGGSPGTTMFSAAPAFVPVTDMALMSLLMRLFHLSPWIKLPSARQKWAIPPPPKRRRLTMQHAVVSRDDWLAARRDLLKAEKELTRIRDKVAQARLALPWVRIDKEYVFETLDGPRTLADLFDGRSQLLVQHFMFAPGWKEGCPSCSFMA